MDEKEDQEEATKTCDGCGATIYKSELCKCKQSTDDKYGQPINQSTKDYGSK